MYEMASTSWSPSSFTISSYSIGVPATLSLNNISNTHLCRCYIIAVIILTIYMEKYYNSSGSDGGNNGSGSVYCMASMQMHHQSTTMNDYFINEMPQEKMDQLKIPKDQTLIVRLPSNTLLKYTSYKDVSILHFRIPPDTRRAMFTFKAIEESKSAFLRKCKPRDVTLHLKASSYPVISPENITFPRNFLNADQRYRIYNLQFKSDEIQQRITVEGPQVGNWFAIAFISWTDPNNERIEQQGLAASCDTLLLAEMSVSRFKPIIINNGQVHNSTLMSNRKDEPSTTTLVTTMNDNDSNNKQQQWSIVNEETTALKSSVALAATVTTTPTIKPYTSKFRKRSEFRQPEEPHNTKNNMITATIEATTGTIETVKYVIPKNKTAVLAMMMEKEKQQLHNQQQSLSSAKASKPLLSEFNMTHTRGQPTMSTACDTSNVCTNNSTHITNNEIIYKFYVPDGIGIATARIKFGQVCLQCPDVGFRIQANAFPSISISDISSTSSTSGTSGTSGTSSTSGTSGSSSTSSTSSSNTQDTTNSNIDSNETVQESNYIHSTIIKPNQTGEILIEFYVQPMSWHYALLQFTNVDSANAVRNLMYPNEFKSFTTVNMNFNEIDENVTKPNENENSNFNNLTGETSRPLKNNIKANCTKVVYRLPFLLQIDFRQPLLDIHINNFKGGSHFNNHLKSNSNNNLFSMFRTPTLNVSQHTTQNESTPWQPIKFRNMDFYSLLRQTYREFFMFDFDLVPDENGTVPPLLNLTGGVPVGFTFNIGEIYDIGGTLSFAISMKHGSKNIVEQAQMVKITPTMPAIINERSGILAEKLVSGPPQGSDESKSLPRSNQTIIVCMHLGEPGEPTWPDKCRYGRRLLPASSIVNNTDANTSTGLVHVPFPESGQWFVTMALYCHGAETAARVTIIDSVKEFIKKYSHLMEQMKPPCACAFKLPLYRACLRNSKCLRAMNETETLKIKECLMDSKCTPNHLEMTQKFEIHHRFATEQHFALDNCSSSVVFTISSSPCVVGRCGRFGRCYHYMSGGFVFSTCVCMKGYRGWDCTEDSQVPSSMSIVLSSLLLTLSNLLFLPSIYMAIRRQYYTEGVIYFFAMFFSIFYHACDSGEDEFSFCLVKIGVLQFCDFYCGLLAIWVTLVAMSHIRQEFISLLHMLGAILLAFGTELNKQSLWVFLAPALTGICIISASWGLRCFKSRKWFPSRKYLTVYMPMGIVLVMVGLICYAFLQTKQNYHIVHSIWHMVMALSILCLLPSRKYFLTKC